MLPGPDYYYECPKCGNLLSKGSLMSGNTFGAKLYSDGKRIAPMLPDFPDLTICSKCNTIFWLSEAKEAGIAEWGEPLKGNAKSSEQVRFLTIYEYFRALENKIYKLKEQELFIRLRIWWGFNDRVRNDEEFFQSEIDHALWIENVNRLLDILDVNDVHEKIMIAELNRNLGNFEKCKKVLASIEKSDLKWLKDAFEKECNLENTKVFQFKLK